MLNSRCDCQVCKLTKELRNSNLKCETVDFILNELYDLECLRFFVERLKKGEVKWEM